MTEKVKLPKAVYDALNVAVFSLDSNSSIVTKTAYKNWTTKATRILNEQDADTIMQALCFGYETELTAEEQIKKIYFSTVSNDSFFDNGLKFGVRNALRIHGIHYDWMEGDKE